ncbi:MAG: bifunctional demethylmenaquinone methyltransferase/2-methoxy-6-polyprenyl-1,4-benzoquinol methylase UbiE [Planctomycetaceae bacterium]
MPTAPITSEPEFSAPPPVSGRVDKSGERVRRMFGEIAGRYDLLNRVLSFGVDVYWRWRTVRKVSPVGEAPVLDVCTGTGDLALAYWKRGEGKVPVIGSDFTHQMLVRAAAKTSKRTASLPIQFVEADAQQLPFQSNLFQIVSVAFGLRNIADTQAGLREMLRVCRPGGKVVVLEFSEPQSRLFGMIYRFYFKHILPRIGQLVSGSRLDAYHYLPESVGEFPCGEKLANVMQECGLTEVEFRPLTFGIATLYWGTKAPSAIASNRA